MNVQNEIYSKLRTILLRGNRDFPGRIVILVANPRSGSTWLFDALRTHPAIEMTPPALLFAHLGLKGRRYPRDLSHVPDAPLRIEVRPGEWVQIPRFQIDDNGASIPTQALQHSAAIEKIHPHFFENNLEKFLKRLSLIRAKSVVRLIYHVRDPEESIVSFLRYKERNPSWNPHRSPAEVLPHMARSFETIAECRRILPGPVADYRELQENFPTTLARLFRFVWSDVPEAIPEQRALRRLIDGAASATARDKRSRSATPFLAEQERPAEASPPRGKATAYGALFFEHREAMARCYEAYNRLLAERQPPEGATTPGTASSAGKSA